MGRIKKITLSIAIVFTINNSFSQLNQYLRSILLENFCSISIIEEDYNLPYSVTFRLKLNNYKNASYYLNNNDYFEEYFIDSNIVIIKNNWSLKEIRIYNRCIEEKVFDYFVEISKFEDLPYIHKTYTQTNNGDYVIFDSIKNEKYDLILKESNEFQNIYLLKKNEELLKTYDIRYNKSNKNLLVSTFDHKTFNFVKLIRKKNDVLNFLKIENNEFYFIKKEIKYTETSKDKVTKDDIEYEIIHPNNKNIIWGNLIIQIKR